MSDHVQVQLLNQTPLTLTLEHVVAGQDPQTIGDVGPLDELTKEIAGAGAIVARDKASRHEIKRFTVTAAAPPLVVAIGDLRSGARTTPTGRVGLTVKNSSSHYVDMHYVNATGVDQRFGPRLAPGETIKHRTEPYQCVVFSSVFTGSPLAAVFAGESAETGVEITSKYLDLQHSKANRPPDQQFGEVKLVGRARKPTPPTSKDYIAKAEHWFLPSATLPEEAPFVQFNTIEGRLLRRVEITGVDIRWDGSDTSGLNAYSGARGVDGDNAGGGNLDIRSLTIHADRVTIAIPLWFPRTDVTIYARELIFQGKGCIDTTPYPFKAAAVSPSYMQDAKGNVYPADAAGHAVYQGADGRNGEPAGRIELFVRDIHGLEGETRFIARGSRGQAAEDGGLKPYRPGANQPKDGKDVAGIPAADVATLKPLVATTTDPDWHWPGDVRSLHDVHELTARFQAKEVGHVKIGFFAKFAAWNNTSNECTCHFLPSRKRMNGPSFLGWDELEAKFDGWSDAGPVPGDGEDAYPSGTPGRGGDGGAVKSHYVALATSHVDVACGEPGPSSKTIEGGEPGKPTWWLMLKVMDHLDNPLRWGKNVQLTEKSAKKGRAAAGIAQDAKAKPGKVLPPDNPPDFGWLHAFALEAVLTHAADAFRKGCNDDARRALEPSYALLTAPGVKAIPDRLISQWVALGAMRTSLNSNTDSYGNPPGWVPRLSATTSYATFQAVRQAASESLFFALKMADEYDALERADELAVHMTELVGKSLETVQDDLREAHRQIGEARTSLDAVQTAIGVKGQELTQLKKKVDEIAKHKVEVQRAFSAACQLVAGLMDICPVGQPILRGVGGVFTAASTFDWNKEDPWAEAGKTFEKIGGAIDGFMEKNKGVLTKVDDGNVLSAEERAVNLGLQLGEMTAALQEDTRTVRSTVASLDDAQRPALSQEMERLRAKIQEGLDTLAAAPGPLRVPVQNWGKAVANAAAENARKKIVVDLAAYRAQLKQLMDQRAAVMQTIMSMKDADNKPFTKDQIKSATALLTDEKVNGLLAHAKAIEDLAAQRQKAELDVKAYKLKNTRAENKKKQTLERVRGLGDGVANIGAAICKVAAPFDEEDPAVRSLVQRMLDSKDSEFHPIYVRLKDELMRLAAAKKREAERLMHWHQAATTLTGRLSGTLDMLDSLGRERQSLNGVLDAGTRTFLKGMQQRARAALQQSIYSFVQAYQYEFLSDPGDDFFSFDDWVARLRKLESAHKEASERRLADARRANAGGSDLEKAQQEADRVIRLDASDFKTIEEQVLNSQLLDIVVALLAKRNHESPPKENRYTGCEFTEAMLEKLNTTGEVTFNFVRDWKKGSFRDTEFRAVDIAIDAFEVRSREDNLSAKIWIQHSGTSVILTREDGKPVHYGFQARKDEAITWGFTWNQPRTGNATPVPDTMREPQLDELLRALLPGRVAKVEEYKPSMFSDFRFSIEDFPFTDRDAVITRVALSVTFQAHPPI